MEHCDVAGCMYELVIQLMVIMIGNQLINNFFEIGLPLLTMCVCACMYAG
jgi:hypothetical protein